MSTWQAFCAEAPDLARQAQQCFAAHKHHTLATLRADGSPRLSGTEVDLRDDDLWLAGMPRARKAADLRRDPRLALHSASEDPPQWRADARIAGHAVEVTGADALRSHARTPPGEPDPAFELFRVDVREVVVVRLGESADHLVIESWHEGTGLRRVERQ